MLRPDVDELSTIRGIPFRIYQISISLSILRIPTTRVATDNILEGIYLPSSSTLEDICLLSSHTQVDTYLSSSFQPVTHSGIQGDNPSKWMLLLVMLGLRDRPDSRVRDETLRDEECTLTEVEEDDNRRRAAFITSQCRTLKITQI